MNGAITGNGEFAYEMKAGQCAVVAALVIALHEVGVLPRTTYCDVLQRLWADMPEDEAVGEAGAVIERVLDLFSAPALGSQPKQRCAKQINIIAATGTYVSGEAIV